jgi:hypothetical protein
MNAFQKTSNIFGTFAPFYYLFKVFGLISFSFQGPIKDGILRSTFMDKFYPLLVSVFHLLAFYSIVYLTSNIHTLMTNFISIVTQAAYFISIATNFISVIGLFFGRKKFISFLKIIDGSDRQVNSI